jgi:hypothetical protein
MSGHTSYPWIMHKKAHNLLLTDDRYMTYGLGFAIRALLKIRFNKTDRMGCPCLSSAFFRRNIGCCYLVDLPAWGHISKSFDGKEICFG